MLYVVNLVVAELIALGVLGLLVTGVGCLLRG